MHARSRSGVDLTVQMPAPRCMTSFSPSANVGHGREMISTGSDVLSG